MPMRLLRVVGQVAWYSIVTAAALGSSGKIGILMKDRTSPYWVYAEKGATERAKALGRDVVIKGAPGIQYVAAQAKLLDALAQENLDALIVSPAVPEKLEKQVAALTAKGVKVVALDTPFAPGVANAFVGIDQSAVGEMAGKLIANLIQDGDAVAIFRNNAVDVASQQREKKVIDTVQASHPRAVIHADVYAAGEIGSEAQQADYLLNRYGGVKAIFCSSTYGTVAMIRAVKAHGLATKVQVVGVGVYLDAEVKQAIQDGVLAGWIAQQTKDLGAKAVEAADALIQGQTLSPVIHSTITLVTKQNFDTPAVQELQQP